MTVSNFAKIVALEIADRAVEKNIGASHDDVMEWLCTTDDGRKYLREEVNARVKLRSTATEAAADDDVGDGVDLLDDDASDVPDDLIDRAVQMHSGKLTRAEALEWLLSHPLGREVVARTKSKTGANMDNVEKLKASRLAKLQEAGPIEIAKSVLRGDDPNNLDLTEDEFTSLVTTAARKQHPDLSAAQAFTQAFAARTEDGALLRKARAKTLADATPVSGFQFPRF
jgi:hypothetical protein